MIVLNHDSLGCSDSPGWPDSLKWPDSLGCPVSGILDHIPEFKIPNKRPQIKKVSSSHLVAIPHGHANRTLSLKQTSRELKRTGKDLVVFKVELFQTETGW